jgi:2,3-dihydroxybenzoate decarboxylase
LLEVGAQRILFSTDYPFEEAGKAARWFDGLAIGEHDRQLIGRENAVQLFGLSAQVR